MIEKALLIHTNFAIFPPACSVKIKIKIFYNVLSSYLYHIFILFKQLGMNNCQTITDLFFIYNPRLAGSNILICY